jgi:hypothetical protein
VQSKARVLSGMSAILGLLVLAASLVSAISCDRLSVLPTPAPTATRIAVSTPPTAPTATPGETPVAEIPPQIVSARDALLVFLRSRYPSKAPSDAVVWIARDTTPPGAQGISTFEFTGDSWLMTVTALSTSPAELIYEMGLDNQQAGLHWTGKLDASYQLLEWNLNLAAEVLAIRDIVLAFVRQHYTSQAPADHLAWIGERTTPFGMVGQETCQFTSVVAAEVTAGAWKMTVGYDLVPAVQRVYEVELSQTGSEFVWRGQVDAEGTILEHR